MLVAWHPNVNARTARESARRPPELGEAPARRGASGPTHLLNRRMARAHTPTRPQGSERRAKGYACCVARGWDRP